VATVYREQNIAEKNKRTKEARSFIEEQLKIIESRLKAAEEKLKAYKKEKRLVVLDLGVTSAIASVADLESQYQKVNRQIEEVSLQLSKLKKETAPFKMRKVFSEDMSPTVSKLNGALLDLIVRRNTLLLNYTEKSPQIEEVESQIRELKATLEQTLSSRSETLRAKRETLGSQLRRMYEDIPEEHLELVRLQREVKVNEDLFSLLKSKYQEALIKEAEQVEEVVIVKSAIEPTKPVRSPKILAITLVGIVIGSILGLVLAIVLEGLDTSIGTIEDVEELLDVPVLGVIAYSRTPEVKEALADKFPKVKDEDTLSRYAYLLSHFAPNTHLAESYQFLRTNIQLKFIEKGVKTLLITSSSPLEGKTITSINLALSLAQAGKKVLLVEADIRKPKICRRFGIGGNEPGLVDMLLGNYNWREVTKDITDIMVGQMSMEEIMLTPGMDNLNILPSGMRHSSPAEIIGSSRMKYFVNEARDEYDVVLYDSPPVLGSSDCAITATYTDGVLVVYQVGETARRALKRAKAQLEAVKANVIGVVLNGVKPEISTDYDTLKYGYYYYSRNSRELNGSLGRMLPSPKGLRQKLGKAGAKQGRRNKEGTVRKGSFAILTLSLVCLAGGILWQHYWGGGTAQSRLPIETEKPQQTFKAEHKAAIKTLPAEAKKTTPSAKKTEKKRPDQGPETIRKVQSENPAPEQKGVLHYPYSIHTSSYSTEKGALYDLKRLAHKGHQGYLSLVDLEKKGTWHRVFIGPFENQQAAEEYLRNLEEFPGARVLSTPSVLESARPGPQEEAKTATKTLPAESKKTTPSVKKPEKTVPDQATETIRQVQLEQLAPEQKGVFHYPYSIHTSSYSTQTRALYDLKRLAHKGHQGYLSLVDLGKKGTWHRVFIGPFESQKAAEEYLRNLEECPGARVLSTPFALELARFGSKKEAIEEQRQLHKKEYASTYMLRTQMPDKDGAGFRLLTGAFHTKEEAQNCLHTLQKDGLEAQVVLR
jgi:capsular exopolysaccharide synthesis family protein